MKTILGRRYHRRFWVVFAALFFSGPATPEGDVRAQPSHLVVGVSLARPHIAVSLPDARKAPAEAETGFEEALGLPGLGVEPANADPVMDGTVAKSAVKFTPLVTPEGCSTNQDCIDQYLWAVYERTRKVDTIKVPEQIKVTVIKKGKTRTITKTIIKFVDDDFTWKDPKAAEKARMTVKSYVIGGMDPSFRVRLFHLLHAMEEAGSRLA